MRWRWITLILAGLLILDVMLGIGVYTTKNWNFNHDQVITGWPAVREYCLIQFPIAVGVAALISGLILLGVRWAMRGDR
jgi:hypothetical protein